MGSDSGQDCERPIHRVWVDAFYLAATQVTNAEYDHSLRATSTTPPPFWKDPNFNHPDQPVVGVSWFEAIRYCDWLSAQTGHRYRLPTEAEWERAARGGLEQKNFPWGDDPPQSLPDYAIRWQTGPAATSPTHPVSTTFVTTFTNGAATGTTRIITPSRPSAIPAARKTASANPPAEAPGAITSKSPAAPPAPASRRNFTTPTTASAYPATRADRAAIFLA
jgi:hypothetical protein